MEEKEDRELVLELRSKDEKKRIEAFASLWKRYRFRIVRLASNILHKAPDDGYCMQVPDEVFIKVWIDPYHYDPHHSSGASFSTWLYRTSVNTSISILRDIKKHENVEKLAEDIDWVAYGKPYSGRMASTIEGVAADIDEGLDYFLVLDDSEDEKYHTREDFIRAKRVVFDWIEKLSVRDRTILEETVKFEHAPVMDVDGKRQIGWKSRKAYVDPETLNDLTRRFNLTRENIRKIRSLRMKELKKILEKEGYTILELKTKSQ